MKCPKCGEVIKFNASTCVCGWKARDNDNGICHDPGCNEDSKQRIGQYWYCLKHYDAVRLRMGNVSDVQRIFQQQLEKTLKGQGE